MFKSVGSFEQKSSDDDSIKTTVIKNFTVNNICIDSIDNIGVIAKNCGNKVLFENIDVHGYAMGALVGGFVGFGPKNVIDVDAFMKLSFKNCISDITLIATQEAAAWIHYPFINDPTIALNSEIIIEVPNANDALLSLYKSKAFTHFTWWSCHLFTFNKNNLKQLVEKAGYKINYSKNIQWHSLILMIIMTC